MHGTRPPEQDPSDMDILTTPHPAHVGYEDENPHIPPRPARRKEATSPQNQIIEDTQSLATDHQRQRKRLTDYVPILGYFAAGGLAGIISRTSTAPLDRLKVYLIAQTGSATEAVKLAKQGAAIQATKHSMSTLWNGCKDLWAAGGMRSLFAGKSSSFEPPM